MTGLQTSDPRYLPIELTEKVVKCIDISASLSTASLLSRQFLFPARQVVFSSIFLHCPSRLQSLVELLQAKECFIPKAIDTLEIQISDRHYSKAYGRRMIRRITTQINIVLRHFKVRSTVSIDLQWMMNEYPGWVTECYVPSSVRFTHIGSMSTLQRLTVHGHLSNLRDLTKALAQLHSLVSLKVCALWKDYGIPPGGCLPPSLSKLEVNTSSLCILGWLASLEQPPTSLRTFRVEAKQECFEDFSHLGAFMRRFGAGLTDVSFGMFPRVVLTEWACYLPFLTSLEHVTLRIQRHIPLPSYRAFLRRWCSKFNSKNLKTITMCHRDWHLDCQAQRLVRWSLRFEAFDSPPNPDEVEITCQIDRSPLLPGDCQAFSLGLWDDEDDEEEGSDQQDDGPVEEDDEQTSEMEDDDVGDEWGAMGEEGTEDEEPAGEDDGEGFEEEEHDEEGYEGEGCSERGYGGEEYDEEGDEEEEFDEERYEEEYDEEGYGGEECNDGGHLEETECEDCVVVEARAISAFAFATNDSLEGLPAAARVPWADPHLVSWLKAAGICPPPTAHSPDPESSSGQAHPSPLPFGST